MASSHHVTAAAIGIAVVHLLTFYAPCPSTAAWGWQTTPKDAPQLTSKMADALWSCAQELVGIDGTASDEYRKANNLEYTSPEMATYFNDKCKCTVVPKPGYSCDIQETTLIGNAKAGHKKATEGDQILPPQLGPLCTNNGYPGADIDCWLSWQTEPVCVEEKAAECGSVRS